MANVTKHYRGYNYVLGSFTLSERSEKQCHYQICSKDVQLGCQGNVSNALFLLPPAGSCGKVMFLHLSVSHSVHGGVLCPSMHHRSHDWGGRSLSGGGSVQGRVSVQGGSWSGRPPPCTVSRGRYASYWNAFLFVMSFNHISVTDHYLQVFLQ